MNTEKGYEMVTRDELLVKQINSAIEDFRLSTRQKSKTINASKVLGLFELLCELNNNHETTINLIDDNWDSGIDNAGQVEAMNYIEHIQKLERKQLEKVAYAKYERKLAKHYEQENVR